jgi:glycosyltransferase involved in cell wall biosynthesis
VITFVDQSHDCVALEQTSDVLLLWRLGALSEQPWDQIAKHYRHNRTRFVVDWSNSRQDGIWFAEAAMVMCRPTRSFDDESRERFRARTQHLQGRATAYLVGTGPSARAALDVDMTDGVRIVCNTVLIDDELMAHVDPHIVAFADPIFHFGPSSYAAAFQRALDRQARHHDFTIVTTERYAALLACQLPHLAERVVGVREVATEHANNFDLLEEVAVRPYPNVLTMLMLPLAATYSTRVAMIGFDGRAPGEAYFWRHGDSVQFARELTEIRSVHPGFFNLDYADYYAEHVNCLERMLTAMERRGMRIESRTPSHMRPLCRRGATALDRPTLGAGDATAPERSTIVSISPDWVDEFGHFGRWERTVRVAANARGFDYRTLASKALAPGHGAAIPAFTHPTLSDRPFDAASFESELRTQLLAFQHVDHRSLVCFYTADIWHLPSLLAIAADKPETIFAANLMRAHRHIADALRVREPWSDAIRSLLATALEAAEGSNLVVCIDTDAAADDVRALTGVRIPVWPMITVADPLVLQAASVERTTQTIRVVAPVQTQGSKGFDEVVEFAERVSPRLRSGEWSLTTRLDPIPTSREARLVGLVARLVAAGGEVIEGSLTDQQFARLLGTADVIVLPYHRDVFRTRTSGLLLDVVAAGKPTVTVRGTWPGDLVQRYRIGRTFHEGDVDAMVRAVARVISQLPRVTGRLADAREEILDVFHPGRLIEFVAALGDERRGRPPAASGVRTTRTLATAMINAYWDRERRRATAEINYSVSLDDLRRSKDDRLDTVESLTRQLRIARARIDVLVASAAADASRSGTLPITGRACDRGKLDDSDRGLDTVVRALHPAAHERGVVVDVGAIHRSSFVELLDARWIVYNIDPRSGRVRVHRLASHHDGHAVIASRPVGQRPRHRHVAAFADRRGSSRRPAPVELRDLTCIAHVDLLNIGADMDAMAVLDGVPWERLRPRVIVVPFDDNRTASAGYSTRDLIDVLSAYGYHLWARMRPSDSGHEGVPTTHRVDGSSTVAEGRPSWGQLLAFLEPGCAELAGFGLERRSR